MRTRRLVRLIAAAVGLALPAAPPAAAQATGASENLPLSVIEQRLAADGFRVHEIERYPNSVEVKGLDRDGVCTEMHLDPRTGAVLRRERDDDCFGDGRRRGRGRD
jgi:hypothetical protein